MDLFGATLTVWTTSATVLLQISDLEGCNFKDVYLAGCIVLIVMVKECMNGHFAPTLIPATQSLSLTVSLEGNLLPPCLGQHTQTLL